MKYFYHIDNFPFLKPFLENKELIFKEFSNAKENFDLFQEFLTDTKLEPYQYSHVYHWQTEQGLFDLDYDARDHIWTAFPLFKDHFPFKWYNPEQYFPNILKLLKNVPNIHFSAFFRAGKNSGSKPHTHIVADHLIFHMCLTEHDEKKCSLTVNNETVYLNKLGDYLIFDYAEMHESKNDSSNERINLIVDFKFPERKLITI